MVFSLYTAKRLSELDHLKVSEFLLSPIPDTLGKSILDTRYKTILSFHSKNIFSGENFPQFKDKCEFLVAASQVKLKVIKEKCKYFRIDVVEPNSLANLT